MATTSAEVDHAAPVPYANSLFSLLRIGRSPKQQQQQRQSRGQKIAQDAKGPPPLGPPLLTERVGAEQTCYYDEGPGRGFRVVKARRASRSFNSSWASTPLIPALEGLCCRTRSGGVTHLPITNHRPQCHKPLNISSRFRNLLDMYVLPEGAQRACMPRGA